jgi:hypothetical protein
METVETKDLKTFDDYLKILDRDNKLPEYFIEILKFNYDDNEESFKRIFFSCINKDLIDIENIDYNKVKNINDI